MTKLFTGSIVALVTPMTSRGRIDSDAYTRLLRFHLGRGTDGIVVGGTTGESATLTPDELSQLLVSAREQLGERVPLIAGTGSASTQHAIELSRLACEAGADACLVVTPYYNKPTQVGLERHYRAIADAIDKPVLLYNVPGRTGCDLAVDTVIRLAGHPRITGIKEATGDIARAPAILNATENFTVLSGDDFSALRLMQAGAHGVVSVTANVTPARMSALCKAARDDDLAAASQIDAQLQPLHRALFVAPNPIPVKYALHRMGLVADGIRLPLTWLEPDAQQDVETALTALGVETATA
ncbi:MAG: 4-hydroxy-tetrahydrodipicolinate synthase [Gammaproteobacteria bacterium]|nr:4-hydroxy-tetrahydrodipicolinate synthase [Gammaproteobacteria bacterium]